jgi:hypothetical protein
MRDGNDKKDEFEGGFTALFFCSLACLNKAKLYLIEYFFKKCKFLLDIIFFLYYSAIT